MKLSNPIAIFIFFMLFALTFLIIAETFFDLSLL